MFHCCPVHSNFSMSAAAHEHVSSYQRFVDPPLMNRYYYQLVNQRTERVSSVTISIVTVTPDGCTQVVSSASYANISEEVLKSSVAMHVV